MTWNDPSLPAKIGPKGMGHVKLFGSSVHDFVVFRHRGNAFLDEALALAPTGSPIKSSFNAQAGWLEQSSGMRQVCLFFLSVHCIKRLDFMLRGSVQGVKIQNKFPGGACPRTPLEACSFGAHLWNRSVVILDLRLVLFTFVAFSGEWWNGVHTTSSSVLPSVLLFSESP